MLKVQLRLQPESQHRIIIKPYFIFFFCLRHKLHIVQLNIKRLGTIFNMKILIIKQFIYIHMSVNRIGGICNHFSHGLSNRHERFLVRLWHFGESWIEFIAETTETTRLQNTRLHLVIRKNARVPPRVIGLKIHL